MDTARSSSRGARAPRSRPEPPTGWLALGLVAFATACAREYPPVTEEAALEGVERGDAVVFEGVVYFYRDGAVVRWEDPSFEVELMGLSSVPSVLDSAPRFFIDGDRLWVRALVARDGPDVVLERSDDGRWTTVALPPGVRSVRRALPGATGLRSRSTARPTIRARRSSSRSASRRRVRTSKRST